MNSSDVQKTIRKNSTWFDEGIKRRFQRTTVHGENTIKVSGEDSDQNTQLDKKINNDGIKGNI